MEISVLNIKGEDTGKKVALNESVFGVEPNDHAIYLDVKQYLAAQRQGTAKSKERSEMSGSTRKLGRQKGGGGARRGDINSPLLVGGARVFGPKPRDYRFKLNKKVKQLARRSALSYKVQEGALVVVEDFSFDAPKTKSFIEVLNNLKVSDKKTLVVAAGSDKNLYLSARNLPKAKVAVASDLNTYGVLDAAVLVVTESAVAKIEEVLAKSSTLLNSNEVMAFIIKPIVTEKLNQLSEKQNKFGFVVKPEANKLQIKAEVEARYGVTVTDVNTMVYAGKSKSRYTRAGLLRGRTNAFKKAVVTVKDGETIDFYSNI